MGVLVLGGLFLRAPGRRASGLTGPVSASRHALSVPLYIATLSGERDGRHWCAFETVLWVRDASRYFVNISQVGTLVFDKAQLDRDGWDAELAIGT